MKPLDFDVEMKLIRESKAGNKESTQKLVAQFEGMIIGLIREVYGKCTFEDMRQHGYVAFLESIQSFDLEMTPPIRLMTWAHLCVSQKIKRRAREESIIHIPRRDSDAIHLVPLMRAAAKCLSYDAPGISHPRGFRHLIADREEYRPHEIASRNEEIALIRKAISILPKNERIAISRKMNGEQFSEIGLILGGVTRQRAQQIEKAGRSRLKLIIEKQLAKKNKPKPRQLDKLNLRSMFRGGYAKNTSVI